MKELLPGDICAYATGTGNGKLSNGHIFVVGKNQWMSNNSEKDREWDTHWTAERAKAYYEDYGGFKPQGFRIVEN